MEKQRGMKRVINDSFKPCNHYYALGQLQNNVFNEKTFSLYLSFLAINHDIKQVATVFH